MVNIQDNADADEMRDNSKTITIDERFFGQGMNGVNKPFHSGMTSVVGDSVCVCV